MEKNMICGVQGKHVDTDVWKEVRNIPRTLETEELKLEKRKDNW